MTVGQPFDGGERTTGSLVSQHQAGESWLTVYQHRAAAAGSHVAASLDAEGADLVTQNIEQDGVALDVDVDLGAVHAG